MKSSKVASRIIGSFEDIGKDIIRETAKVPQDIAGKALETMGASQGKSGQKAAQSAASGGVNTERPPDSWDRIDSVADRNVKQNIAREALKALLERKTPAASDDYERRIREEKEKKLIQEKTKKEQEKSRLPEIRGKARRGNLYGIKTKQSPTERGKNVIAQ